MLRKIYAITPTRYGLVHTKLFCTEHMACGICIILIILMF